MLARPDRLPHGDYSFEVKWDGFRAIVSTENGLVVRSRRGWSMSERLPELVGLPTGLKINPGSGAITVASQLTGNARVLHGRVGIGVTFMVFDVLRVEGLDAVCLPYAERRALLDELDLNGRAWRTPEVFEDGPALMEATRRLGLEGIVAKRRSERYRPGERRWIKTKHHSYWRFGQELDFARSRQVQSI